MPNRFHLSGDNCCNTWCTRSRPGCSIVRTQHLPSNDMKKERLLKSEQKLKPVSFLASQFLDVFEKAIDIGFACTIILAANALMFVDKEECTAVNESIGLRTVFDRR